MFKIPDSCAPLLSGIDFTRALPIAADNVALFGTADRTTRRDDPSGCNGIFAISPLATGGTGVVCWSAKLAIDSDGPAASANHRSGSEMDDTGQDDTSYHLAGGFGVPSETVPYYVLPGGSFRENTGLGLGDVGMVIYGGKLQPVIFADIGPKSAIGEASIRTHEGIHPPAPDPCSKRGANGACLRIRDCSIDPGVIVVAFPKSTFAEATLTLANIESVVAERAMTLFNALRGHGAVA